MKPACAIRLYERKDFQQITGPTIRPGGLTLTRRALEKCRFTTGARVLDAGCGIGGTLDYLKKQHALRTIGIDRSKTQLKQGRKRNAEHPLMVSDIGHIPLGDETLEGIFCECVLSLHDDRQRVLSEFHRVLHASGELILTDVYARALQVNDTLRNLPLSCCFKGALPRSDIMREVRQAGFEIVCFEDHSRLLKELAARLIFVYGSMENFWECSGNINHPEAFQGAIGHTRPGYYLLIADKKRGLRYHG